MKKAKLILPIVVSASAILLPVTVATATASTTVSSVVSAVISMSSSGTVNINTTPTSSGAETIASDIVTVSTNDTAGYTLTLADGDATTTLASGGNNIAASSGTQASPVALTTGKWGYRVDSVGGFGAGPTSSASNASVGATTFAGVPASGSANTIKATASTATNDTTTVWYGVATNTSTPSGTYTDSVTYTGTTN